MKRTCGLYVQFPMLSAYEHWTCFVLPPEACNGEPVITISADKKTERRWCHRIFLQEIQRNITSTWEGSHRLKKGYYPSPSLTNEFTGESYRSLGEELTSGAWQLYHPEVPWVTPRQLHYQWVTQSTVQLLNNCGEERDLVWSSWRLGMAHGPEAPHKGINKPDSMRVSCGWS